MDSRLFTLHAKLCQVFSSEKRLRIVWLLAAGEQSVGSLAQELGCAPANVSQHLRVMRDMHVVDSRKDAQTTYYCLRNNKLYKGLLQIRTALAEEFGRVTRDVAQAAKS